MRTKRSTSSFGRRGILAGAVAAGANAAIYLIGRAADVTFLVPNFEGGAPTRVPLGQVVFVSLVTVLIGFGLASFADRRGKLTHVRWSGAVFALLSLAAPLSLNTAASTKLLLALMHVVGGATFFMALRRSTERDDQPAPVSATAVTS